MTALATGFEGVLAKIVPRLRLAPELQLKSLSSRVEPTMAEELRRLAAEKSCTTSALIARVLREHLARAGRLPEPTKHRRRIAPSRLLRSSKHETRHGACVGGSMPPRSYGMHATTYRRIVDEIRLREREHLGKVRLPNRLRRLIGKEMGLDPELVQRAFKRA